MGFDGRVRACCETSTIFALGLRLLKGTNYEFSKRFVPKMKLIYISNFVKFYRAVSEIRFKLF